MYDPTLVAPEIAVSALMHKGSRLMKRGLSFLESGNYPDSLLSELAAVIATEEMERGTGRKVRQLFRRSLISPNENTIAQVRWAASKTGVVEFKPAYLRVDRSFEARAWSRFEDGDWGQALTQAKAWLSDQGFSRRPAALGSFVAAVTMEDHVEAIGILRRGLMSNPNDPLLLNNLAYSLACLGRLEEASETLKHMTTPDDDSCEVPLSIVKAATSGLIEYRKGNVSLGRSLYEKAYGLARGEGLDRARARVVMFLALEEARSGAALAEPSGVTQNRP